LLRRLRQWSMIEVYLVGLFVAYTKLRSLVQITIGPALWALMALMLVVIAADALLDPEAVWQALEQHPTPDPAALADGIACHTCGALSPAGPRCDRCGAALHRRKPDSIARTWALATAALVLYLPANIYPVLTYTQLGSGSPSTILGGARELLDAGQWPLALIVFVASIAVPVLKLAALFTMLITTQLGLAARLHDRTVLYRVIEAVGRWSMIDIFMESILVALVQFGGLVTITPGVGALAFGAVVVLTMLAAEAFDPRLMWDRAGQ
jgi:paraquat-inducible protein A